MAFMKRSYGGIQPCIKAGLLRIRLPFVHFKISPPEIATGLMKMCIRDSSRAVASSNDGLGAQACGQAAEAMLGNGLALAALGKLGEVLAGAEDFAGAGDDDCTNGRVELLSLIHI